MGSLLRCSAAGVNGEGCDVYVVEVGWESIGESVVRAVA